MEIKKAVEILENHNKWRRDNDNIYPSTSPIQLGLAIDTIVDHFKYTSGNVEQSVNPEHYKQGDKEVWQMMIELFGVEAFKNFCKLNAFKYRMRAGYKDDAKQDINKAIWYEKKLKEL